MILNCTGIKSKYEVVIEKSAFLHFKDYLNNYSKVFFVIDSKVDVSPIKEIIQDNFVYYIEAKEENKKIDKCLTMLNLLFTYDFDKSDAIVAIGGGITLDMASLTASLFKRGIDLIHVPSTLLAMVDASIGGKNGVNYLNNKNQIGTFYFPKKVIVDIDLLKTLDERQFNNGLCEVIKMGLTLDKKILKLIENYEDNLEQIICLCLKAKEKIVKKDLFDAKSRHVLNFGHTLGHALEMNSQGRLLHGECVLLGMRYFCEDNILPILDKFIEKFKIEFEKPSFDDLKTQLKQDKKVKNEEIDVVYLNDIESYVIKTIELEKVKDIFERR